MKYATPGHKDGSWLSIIDVNEELYHGKGCKSVPLWVRAAEETDLGTEF